MFSVGASCPVSGRRMSLSSTWLGSSTGGRNFRCPDSVGLKGVRKNYAWKAKTEYFGVDLKTDITVESDTVGPCSTIKGHLLIETKFPIEHDGIFVQLEALCDLKYSNIWNERTSMYKGAGCILENTKVNEFGHLESPIKAEIIPVTPPEFGGHSLNSGAFNYPFQLQIPSESLRLPAPFQSAHGSLDYRLVAYLISHSSATYVKLTEKIMKCDGHYNLYDDLEESSKPIVLVQAKHYHRKSYFSQKKQVKAVLSVKTSGFLQHEDIPFSLFIKNPKCTPLNLSMQLQQHVKYQATSNLASVVKIVTTVESLEKDESDEPKPEIEWTGTLRVPESQAPTYACNTMYSLNYMLEFQVKSIEDEVVVTGQARILLGTTRDPIKQIECSSEEAVPGTSGDLYRSGSESSIHSQRSIYSTPIAYSVPANLNLSIDEPDEDEEDDDNDQEQHLEHISPSSSAAHLRPTNSPSPHHSRQIRSHSHHDITETLQEEDEVMEPFPSATYHTTTSVNSLLSTQSVLTLPPSYSQLSSRIQSTETLPPTYADLDLSVESSQSLIIADAVDLEKRYTINLDNLNLQDEYQVTFYSV